MFSLSWILLFVIDLSLRDQWDWLPQNLTLVKPWIINVIYFFVPKSQHAA